jgi:rhodanese-related sulfurtransferase
VEEFQMSDTTPEITVDRLASERAEGGAVVDVREPGEYVAGHVPGATLIPMGQLSSRLAELDKSRPVYLVCASGNRSAAMTDLLLAAGYDAYSVAGGTSAWARSGRPVETGAPCPS